MRADVIKSVKYLYENDLDIIFLIISGFKTDIR